MNETKSSVSKRKVVAIAAAAAAFAAVTVSAATLGGLQTDSVGANDNVVVAPVSKGVALKWETKYSQDSNTYVIADVKLAPLASEEKIPAASTVNLTLTGKDHKVLGEYVSTNGAKSWTGPEQAITAQAVEGASVVINGGAVTNVVSATN